MKHKSEVFEHFKNFERRVTNECGKSIKSLRTDNGCEYLSNEFQIYLKSKGIHHELTIPHSPQQNGIAERMNRILLESTCSMILQTGVSKKFEVKTAAYIHNQTPITFFHNSKTPYEMWYKRKPDISNLHVFGCISYAHIPSSKRSKLDKKAQKMQFIGYCTSSKGYRLYKEDTKRLIKSRDVVFYETVFSYNENRPNEETTPTLNLVDLEENETNNTISDDNNNLDNDPVEIESQPTFTEPRRSS